MVGLGLFQKLSQNATAVVPPDRTEGERDEPQLRAAATET